MDKYFESITNGCTYTANSLYSVFSIFSAISLVNNKINSKQADLKRLESEYAHLLNETINVHEEITQEMHNYNKSIEDEALALTKTKQHKQKMLVEMIGGSGFGDSEGEFIQGKVQTSIKQTTELYQLLYSIPRLPDDYERLSIEAKKTVINTVITELNEHNTLLRQVFTDFFRRNSEENKSYKIMINQHKMR